MTLIVPPAVVVDDVTTDSGVSVCGRFVL